jgi:hypothetical protein
MDGEPISELEFGGDRRVAESTVETLRATGRAYLDPLEESLG